MNRIPTSNGYAIDNISKMQQHQIYDLVRTPQEGYLCGGSPEGKITKQSEVFTPWGVIKGDITVEKAKELRQQLGYFASVGNPFWKEHDGMLAFGFSDLNEDGTTKEKPNILGFYVEDEQGNAVFETVTDRNLTAEYYQLPRIKENAAEDFRLSNGFELFQSEGTVVREKESPTGIEKEPN